MLTASTRAVALAALWLTASACGPSTAGGVAGSSGGAASSGGSSSGGSSSGGSASSGGADACVGTSSRAQLAPLDLFVMLDRSQSMQEVVGGQTKWQAVTGALLSFVAQPGLEDVAVGLQYFPLQSSGGVSGGVSCAAADYALPDVEIAPVVEAASRMSASIAGHATVQGTPTSAALRGALDHARAWASAEVRATHAVAVVLATDGAPTQCDTDLAAIDAIAAAGLGGRPSIRTFVVGVGDLKDNLDGIARAGGTGAAIIVQTTGDVNAQFLAALAAIRGTAVRCTYLIPDAPTGQQLDFGRVVVRYTPGGGAAVTFARADDAAACGTRDDAWRYDDPAKPLQIVLCPAACDRVEADAAGAVDVVLGCTSPNIAR